MGNYFLKQVGKPGTDCRLFSRYSGCAGCNSAGDNDMPGDSEMHGGRRRCDGSGRNISNLLTLRRH
jgi:hypothetical protein